MMYQRPKEHEVLRFYGGAVEVVSEKPKRVPKGTAAEEIDQKPKEEEENQ